MPNVELAWVDQPLVTVEKRVPVKRWFPWQSSVKGVSQIYISFSAYARLEDGNTIKIDIPKGFITDFYSIPRLVRFLIPRSQVGWNQAAVVHDALYADNQAALFLESDRKWITGVPVSRHTADQVFLALMQQLEAPPVRTQLIYQGVRIGGEAVWNSYREGEEQWQHSDRLM